MVARYAHMVSQGKDSRHSFSAKEATPQPWLYEEFEETPDARVQFTE